MISASKKDYLQQYLEESSNNQSTLFKCVSELFNHKKTPLPSKENTKELCNRETNFFSETIKAIHDGLTAL